MDIKECLDYLKEMNEDRFGAGYISKELSFAISVLERLEKKRLEGMFCKVFCNSKPCRNKKLYICSYREKIPALLTELTKEKE